jgi:hypothetical protein
VAAGELGGAPPGEDLKSLSIEELFAQLREGFREQGCPEGVELAAALQRKFKSKTQQTYRLKKQTRAIHGRIHLVRAETWRLVSGPALQPRRVRMRRVRRRNVRTQRAQARAPGSSSDDDPDPDHVVARLSVGGWA